MIEFMDEDELLAEFHKAGIWLPEEREAQKRAREAGERFRAFLGSQGGPFARDAGAISLARQQQLLAAQQRIPSAFERRLQGGPRSGLGGGIFGGLFG